MPSTVPQELLITPTRQFPAIGLWLAVAVALGSILIPLLMSRFYPSSVYFRKSWKIHAIVVISLALVIPFLLSATKLQVHDGSLSFVPSALVTYSMPLSEMGFRKLVTVGGSSSETIVSKNGYEIISIPSDLFSTTDLLQLDCILQPYAPWRADVDLAKAASYGFTTAPGYKAIQCRRPHP
jgi:hypothetical protein